MDNDKVNLIVRQKWIYRQNQYFVAKGSFHTFLSHFSEVIIGHNIMEAGKI